MPSKLTAEPENHVIEFIIIIIIIIIIIKFIYETLYKIVHKTMISKRCTHKIK